MDSYPEDLLVGVFPLVFAVNAIIADEYEENGGSSTRRSLFDRFLDAVASSLIDDVEGDGAADNQQDKRRAISLFKPDEEDESSDDECVLLDEFGARRRPGPSFSNAVYPGFGRRGQTPRDTGAAPTNEGSGNSSATKTSYAKALTEGQGFFQRARIESISVRHGFPPSKDPEGTEHWVHALSLAMKNRNKSLLKGIFDKHPIQGILSAGWLEKHVHALPSAIMVVVTVCSSQNTQFAQDQRLYETIEHLQYSLVPKRQCKIHIIGLMDDDVTMIQADGWSRTISNHLLPSEGGPPSTEPLLKVTLLRASSDLDSGDTGMPISHSMKSLHKNVRDTSLSYYLEQARRTKAKLTKLLQTDDAAARQRNRRGQQYDSPILADPLLPVAIRYCFKIAMFYEFQWKHEKSLKFMAEAYRYVTRYFQYLLELQQQSKNKGEGTNQENANQFNSVSTDSRDSVEITLSDHRPTNNDLAVLNSVLSPPPDDMGHQCRTVAEWLNLKLLLAGFSSRTDGGLFAAANQWRQHSRVFCTRRYPATVSTQEWFEFSYVARQRLVMSELVERHPPKVMRNAGNEHDEILIRCSPWRTYESAAEAMLRLGREVKKMKSSISEPQNYEIDQSDTDRDKRPRYVGGLDREGLAPKLREEYKINHQEKALDLIQRAISIFERELEKEKRGFYAEDDFSEDASSRTGARLYYVAGGTLLGLERHKEAAGHLAKAAKYSRGWRELELVIHRMLIECYEKHIPSETESEGSSETLASMILDSYFNAEMSSRDLRRALNHFGSMCGGESLKWYHDTVDEEDSSLPFSFAVTFPGTTHATAGDSVKACVFVKSNLDYAVHVNSMVLLSLLGQLNIPANDLLRATNANEGHEGGIIIQAQTSIVLTTQLALPKDLSTIAVDETGNGGQAQGVAGKGSFAKSARPRTSGITSAGGARLVSEDQLSRGNTISQGWNLRFLGGKPLRCDGLRLLFYPVQAEKASGSAESVSMIELTIEKKKPKTAVNIKRTPFEEQNYIASAWSRPLNIPFDRGPRCLRVLGPLPQLVVTNVTDAATNGIALEGTVNRVLLKLQAGPHERCTDFNVSLSCFSVLTTPSGETKRLVPEKEITPESEGLFNMANPAFRTPILVVPCTKDSASPSAPFGYELPGGWSTAGSGHGYTKSNLPSLKRGESTFIGLDIYRPAPFLQEKDSSPNNNAGTGICKTDFYITISYRQEPVAQTQKPNRRASRRRPRMSGTTKAEDGNEGPKGDGGVRETEDPTKAPSDEVSLEYTGSVVWEQPISATFSPGTTKCHPSASRHSSNAMEDPRVGENELAFLDGERITTRCSLQANPAAGLVTEIVAISFEDDAGSDSPLDLLLMRKRKANEGVGVLYKPSRDDPCRILSEGTKFSIGYTVQPLMKTDYKSSSVSSTLGALLVGWLATALDLPDEAKGHSGTLGAITSHGPLALDDPSKIRFTGPPCSIERAPFEVTLQTMPSTVRVAVPFEVDYCIKNNTNLHQTMQIRMIKEGKLDGLLLSGLVNGEISLAPYEVQFHSYTVLAIRAGEICFPGLQVSSLRYKSWVINKETTPKNFIYVYP